MKQQSGVSDMEYFYINAEGVILNEKANVLGKAIKESLDLYVKEHNIDNYELHSIELPTEEDTIFKIGYKIL